MEFQDFLDVIPKIRKESLTGEDSHVKMAPPERKIKMDEIDVANLNPRIAAVMMLVYPKNGKANLALIIRNSYKGVHSSQVAFPGGKAEPEDSSFEQTALRETHEEIGIEPEAITVVRSFSNIYIPPSNFMVSPFLGYSLSELVFFPDPAEVAAMVEVPLEMFLDDQTIVNNRMATSYSESVDVPAFQIDGHVIWGATAMMLSELKDVLKKVF
jgi:8-oxo-dGTP pyrophosphatase MutT (NUDIX family)